MRQDDSAADNEVAAGEYTMVEDFLNGKFTKWNSNNGYVADGDVSVQAFCHWTYHQSNGQYLFCDAQGIRHMNKYILTDPCIVSNTHKRGTYGQTDIGRWFLLNWFLNHKCNDICKSQNWISPSTEELESIPQEIKKKTSIHTSYGLSKDEVTLLNELENSDIFDSETLIPKQNKFQSKLEDFFTEEKENQECEKKEESNELESVNCGIDGLGFREKQIFNECEKRKGFKQILMKELKKNDNINSIGYVKKVVLLSSQQTNVIYVLLLSESKVILINKNSMELKESMSLDKINEFQVLSNKVFQFRHDNIIKKFECIDSDSSQWKTVFQHVTESVANPNVSDDSDGQIDNLD